MLKLLGRGGFGWADGWIASCSGPKLFVVGVISLSLNIHVALWIDNQINWQIANTDNNEA
jgi:hypothetical protein